MTFGNGGERPVPGEPIDEPKSNLHGRIRQTCQLCGECDVGCNYGSKNTLDYNYLSAAEREGADLRTLHEVRTFRPQDDGYEIFYVVHDAEPDDSAPDDLQSMTADRLVLSAGTLGSTYLLLKNREHLSGLSDILDSRFSGNGDLLGFAVDAEEPAREGGGPQARTLNPNRGPVITSTIRVGDLLDDDDAGPGRAESVAHHRRHDRPDRRPHHRNGEQAALLPALERLLDRDGGIRGRIGTGRDGLSLWIDYTADLGDGFNPTYTVARLLAERYLTVDGEETERGSLLVMGGDQVYPAASRTAYRNRLVGPHEAALPCVTDETPPALFAIPGNHDWYDGLTNFLRLFTQNRWIGGWRTHQRRSWYVDFPTESFRVGHLPRSIWEYPRTLGRGAGTLIRSFGPDASSNCFEHR